MNRVFFALAVLVIVGVAAWAYHINYRTKSTLNAVADLRAEIAARREGLQVLRVEWAYLNRPERLKALVEAHPELALVPIGPDRFGAVAAVPYPPLEAVDPLEAALAAAIASGAFLRPVPQETAPAAAEAAELALAAAGPGLPAFVPIKLRGDGRMVGRALVEVREGATHYTLDDFEHLDVPSRTEEAEPPVANARAAAPVAAAMPPEAAKAAAPPEAAVPTDATASVEPPAPPADAGPGQADLAAAPPADAAPDATGEALADAGALRLAPPPPPRRARQ